MDTMKARINGIELEGSPSQIAEVIRLAKFAKEVQEVIRYVPTWLPQPQPQPYTPWWEGQWVPCGTGYGSTTGGPCAVTLTV